MNLALVSFYLIAAALAEPSSSSLSSQTADYDGSTLLLKGQVLLDHGLGKMKAEEASLERQEMGKEFPFSLIHLNKEVLLSLPTGAKLSCEKADLDFTSLNGFLFAKEGDKIVYTTPCKKDNTALVCLMSREAELGMIKRGHDGKKSSFDLETILAKNDVIIDYANSFTLRADHAIYRAASLKESPMITAYPEENGARCLLTHEGDSIEADLVNFDLSHLSLSLHKPSGTLRLSLSKQLPQTEMAFKADQLVWHHSKDTLLLKGDVWVAEPSMGLVTCDDEILITQQQREDKRFFKSLQTKGNTALTYRDSSQNKTHKLISHGPLTLDNQQLTAILDSPTAEGIVPEDKQMYYEEEEFAVFADKAVLEYESNGSSLHPVSLTLKGHVRLFTHDPKHAPLCGLADRLNYSPATRTLILSAEAPRKVLFWDEAQGMRLSAPEIHITQGPETDKRSIKGIGAVRFSFTSEEEAKLQKLFSFYKAIP